MGYYETLEECALVAECIPMGIGSNTTLRKCIIDKNARIGSNVQIVNAAGVQEATHEEEGYIIKGDRRRRQGRRHLGRHDHLMTGGPVLLDSGSRRNPCSAPPRGQPPKKYQVNFHNNKRAS